VVVEIWYPTGIHFAYWHIYWFLDVVVYGYASRELQMCCRVVECVYVGYGMDIISLQHGIIIIVLGLWMYYNVYGSFWDILTDSDSDTLAMWIAGVASVAGSWCYRSCHARTSYRELFGLVWGFIASGGAIPILNSEFLWHY